MTAVGMFAGRGDVVLAMLMATVFGIWIGWHLKKFKNWWVARRAAKTARPS